MATLSPAALERSKHFPFNFVVNILDGGFFGLGLGFASFSTVIALFVSNLTGSAILIGLIPAIHTVGWQLPQLFTAHSVSKQKRYKPMVLFFTIHERLPFLGLAAVAWFIPHLGPDIALALTFIFLVWQGFGGGLTANAWQSMIGKIIPGERLGFFFGFQSAFGSLLSSVGAVLAGIVLVNNVPTVGFTACFLFACGAFVASYIAVAFTRESETLPLAIPLARSAFWSDVREILRRDANFRWFIGARILSQLGTVGFAFYSVYLVRIYGVDEATAGVLTGVLLFTQTLFNPILGWLGDRWSHRGVIAVEMTCAAISAAIAWRAPSVGWFYPAYALAGIGYIGLWTTAMTMTLQFGREHEKPSYIGLANTLIAPTAFLIPLIGGWLADFAGYGATFLASTLGAVTTVLVLSLVMKDHPKALPIEA